MSYKLLQGDALEVLKTLGDKSVQTCITSPPYYGLRDYGVDGQIGMEETPEEYIERLVNVFKEVKRVLKDDGTLWVNIGDSYCSSNGIERVTNEYKREGRSGASANDRDLTKLHSCGYKTKDLLGIPWMLAFALRADGWYLRQDIIWQKPNPTPEPVTDRCTRSHEYIFLLSKSSKYLFNNEDIKEDALYANDSRRDCGRIEYEGKRSNGEDKNCQISFVKIVERRNKRDVWSVPVSTYKGAHFATYPEKLIEPCVLAGSNENDTVLDVFNGSGTTGAVAIKHGRNYIGIDLNSDYLELAENRLMNATIEKSKDKLW